MSTAEAEATEFDSATKELGDKIVGLTLLEAKKVVDYLKDAHNIEPAGGGAMVMAGPAGDDDGVSRDLPGIEVVAVAVVVVKTIPKANLHVGVDGTVFFD